MLTKTIFLSLKGVACVSLNQFYAIIIFIYLIKSVYTLRVAIHKELPSE